MNTKKQKLLQNIGFLTGGAAALFVFIAPLARLLAMSLSIPGGVGIDRYLELLAETRTLRAIGNTVYIAVFSTLIAVLLGSAMAFLVAYTDISHKKWVGLLMLTPYVIPSYIITLSWSVAFSARGSLNQFLQSVLGCKVNLYSLGGIILVMGICNAPVVYLNVLPLLRRIPRDLEWAARISGYGVADTVAKIDLAQAAPAVASGGMLAFLAAIDNFSVPAFLGIPAGIPVLSTYIYENVIGFGPTAFQLAAALSVMLSAIALGGTALQGLMVKKSCGLESIREDHSVRVTLGRWRAPVQWGSLAFLLLVNIFPLITTVTSSFFPAYGKLSLGRITLENYRFVFTNRGVRQAITNSLALALVTCLVCTVLGTMLAYRKVRLHCPASRLVEQCASLSYAIPGIVLALSMIFHWTAIPGIYGTIRILFIAYITRYLVLQIKSSANALGALDASLEEASAMCGGSRLRTWGQVILPLTLKPILSGTFLIFMQSLTELTLSSMLAAAGTKTIGLTIFGLQQGGDDQRAAALSAVIIFAVGGCWVLWALAGCARQWLLAHRQHSLHLAPKAA